MEDFVIETQIDKLIDLLSKRRKISLSEASRILNVKESQVEQWVGTLEDRGVVELKYPVLGEPEIVIKGIVPENIKVETRRVEIKPEVKPEEVSVSNEVGETRIEERVERPYPETKKILEDEEKEIKMISEKIINIEKKISEITEELDVSKLKEDLFETLIIISSLGDVEKITTYIGHVERIILFLKAKSILDDTDKDLIVSTLRNISENWKYAKREDVAKIFEEMVKKIETI